MLNNLAKKIALWRKSKEFYTPESLDSVDKRDAMLGKLMLVVSEVAEASEAVRHNDLVNFKEEVADAFIRLLDICGTMEIDIEKEIYEKMNINWDRPIKHGKKTNL